MRGQRRRSRRPVFHAAVALVALVLLSGCVRPAAPGPAVIRDTPPPWDAPRDAISYIDAAGLVAQPLATSGDSHIVTMTITVDGRPVPVPAFVGVDRLRAQQAPVHTHSADNQVWLEGPGGDDVTLGQFFAVWGVRFDGRCLGAACGALIVTADGAPVPDPAALPLVYVERLEITARS